jgi:putative tryptophan/tyrosine transport system substrate-binding protein
VVTAELMFGNQTLLCQVVLPVRSCAAAIRPDRERAWERAWRARPAGRLAKLLGLTVTSVQFDKLPHDIESAFQIARENRAQMVHVLSSPVLNQYRSRIAELAIRDRLPTRFIFRGYVDAGGLMSYGANRVANIRQLAHMLPRFCGARSLPICRSSSRQRTN